MNPTIKIISASPEDASVLGYIQSETWLSCYVNKEQSIMYSDIKAKVDEWQQMGDERIKKEIQKVNAHTWIAKEGDLAIGFVAALKENKQNQIEALHVLPQYQGQGIGTALLKIAFVWLGEDKPVVIEVVAYNLTAQAFYKKHGFKLMGEALEDPIILPNGKRISKVLMWRSIG
jgi:ribosomal protein S18 acetylase RimI-like enzyme